MNVTLQEQAVRMARLVGTDDSAGGDGGVLGLAVGLARYRPVVRVAARPVVTGWEAMDNEVVVQGTVDFVAIYAHEREVPVAVQDIEAERGYDEDATSRRRSMSRVP